jgi:hypothetical protein
MIKLRMQIFRGDLSGSDPTGGSWRGRGIIARDGQHKEGKHDELESRTR